LAVDQAVVLDFQDTRLILVPKLVQLVSSETLMNSTRGPDGEVLLLTRKERIQDAMSKGFNVKLKGVERNSIRIPRVFQDLYKSLLSVIAMDDI
ncbi:hypothetical protein BGZ88_006069, partial [Linnemannia elongata]